MTQHHCSFSSFTIQRPDLNARKIFFSFKRTRLTIRNEKYSHFFYIDRLLCTPIPILIIRIHFVLTFEQILVLQPTQRSEVIVLVVIRRVAFVFVTAGVHVFRRQFFLQLHWHKTGRWVSLLLYTVDRHEYLINDYKCAGQDTIHNNDVTCIISWYILYVITNR